jgi:GT2 family glycosyltransferase
MKIGAVVLNYETYEETFACVKSLLLQSHPDFEVVVVDNGSTNDSVERLKERFAGCGRVSVLACSENVGFARGNNVGIRHARGKLRCDCVFVVNSDVVVDREVFSQIATGVYVGERIGVASPTVHRPDGSEERALYDPWGTFERLVMGHVSREEEGRCFPLHGCAFFLMPDFFLYYDQLYPLTFLYWEESNLIRYLKRAKLKSILVETSPVMHKKAQTTRALFGEGRYRIRRWRHILRSMAVSLPLLFLDAGRIRERYS